MTDNRLHFTALTLLLILLCAFTCGAQAESAFVAPCIEAPYDHEHRAEDQQILIRRFEEDGVVFFVCDVQLTSPEQFRTALSSDKPGGAYEAVSKIAARKEAVFAINCDDYGTHKYGIIIRNGECIRARSTARHMLAVDAEGNFTIYADRSGEDSKALSEKLLAEGVLHTFEFGPELVRNGEAVEIPRKFELISTKPGAREPRTAIGQIGPLHYVIIVADGRQKNYSRGLSLQELQALLLRFGARTAMNLDGGGSTTLWFEGEVINCPSQGKERKVTDIICFQ